MKFVIVTGLSGSGKSVALHALEDCGHLCIDNLPLDLMPALACNLLDHRSPNREQVAIGIDARSPALDLADIPGIVRDLTARGVSPQVLFLEADDAVLLRRFSETRRRHPLSGDNRPLSQAVADERALLANLRQNADLVVDTSRTNLHQLREHIQTVVARRESGLSLLLRSFGYKHGLPRDVDLLFDARCLSNPYWHKELRALSGKDPAVQEFLLADPRTERFYQQVNEFLATWIPCFEKEGRSYLTVGIGCTGGHHRSVFLVERLADQFRAAGRSPLVQHRDLT
jgi:UPF0042 nucleotide-binding protein